MALNTMIDICELTIARFAGSRNFWCVPVPWAYAQGFMLVARSAGCAPFREVVADWDTVKSEACRCS